MGKARPATEGHLLQEMSAGQRQTCKRIERLFAEAEHDFAWHHRLGHLLIDLRAGEERLPRGWLRRLADRPNRSASLLTKSVAFAQQYAAEEAAELDRLGAGWDRLVLTLAVEDKARRLPLLQAARANAGEYCKTLPALLCRWACARRMAPADGQVLTAST